MSDLIPGHATWLQEHCHRRPRTIWARERLLRHAERHLPYGLDQAHTDEITYYLADPEWSVWTRHNYFGHLAGYYQWAWSAKHLTINPMAGLQRPPEGDRIPNPVTSEELATALDRLPRQPWRMAVLLAAYAGLRCCEIVAARREHCTPTLLRVVGKGGRMRAVSMSPVLWAEIEDQPRGLLCVGARGRALTADVLSQKQGPVWRRIGLEPEVHMHRFRHWFATNLLEAGATLPEVQELMGHASIATTVNYTKVVDSRRLAAVRRLPVVGHEPGSSRLVPPAAEAA